MFRSLLFVLSSLAISLASAQDAVSQKTLVSGPGYINIINFDGSNFEVLANLSRVGVTPSWILLKDKTTLYAVDENSNITNTLAIDLDADTLEVIQNATGSTGVVHLELTEDGNFMVGSAFGNSTIDIWDASGPQGNLTLLKTIPVTDSVGPNVDRQDSPHPHESVRDPSGKFFITNDLGTDILSVINAQDGKFEITNKVNVLPPGKKATHYIVVCEILNLVTVFRVDYLLDTLKLTQVQQLSTFGKDFPPVNFTSAAAGEILLASNNRDFYVTNRITGNDTDSIAHFTICQENHGDNISVAFADTVSSLGLTPRMASLGPSIDDNSIMLVTNQMGDNGLVALSRDEETGALNPEPLATLPNSLFGDVGFGPQFAMFEDAFPVFPL